MGVVYKGRDTKLNRSVAIKLLSKTLADPAARRRFQREAEMASSLNHPNILTVYDAGDFDGQQYLVTEFVDGGTLRDWMRARKRSWPEMVELLLGVADALATAHAAGILHRDIKPDNILVTKSGYAKLADFGVAKLEPSVAPDDTTRTLTATTPGLVVGSIPYMSPEQAKGQPVDARSDVFPWAWCCMKCSAGRRPFTGASDLEVLQKIIDGKPNPVHEDIPLALRIVVEKALEKDPVDRYQTMRELTVDLRRIARQKVTMASTPAAIAKTPVPWLAWLLTALLAVAVGLREITRPRPVPENPLAGARFTRLTNFEGAEHGAAISPDGKWVAFRADREGPLDLS